MQIRSGILKLLLLNK